MLKKTACHFHTLIVFLSQVFYLILKLKFVNSMLADLKVGKVPFNYFFPSTTNILNTCYTIKGSNYETRLFDIFTK